MLLSLAPLSIAAWMWLAWAAYWFVAARFVQATRSSEGWVGRVQHLAPLAAGFVLIFNPSGRWLVHGRYYDGGNVGYLADAVVAGGLLFAVYGRLHLGRYWSGIITLKEGHRLIRTGPYAVVRHPLYTGFLAGVLGSAAAAGSVDALLGAGMIVAAYLVKIRREESLLTGAFGEEYVRFKAEVPALVPVVFGGRGDAGIASEAFRRATLRSERRRVVGILVALAALAVVTTTRALARPEPGEWIRLPLALGFLLCGAGYEALLLWIVRRAERAGRAVRAWVWVANTVIEAAVPTLALLLLTLDRYYLGPYRALVAPVVLLYCVFIILATLRLSPGLCVLSGVISAAGYAGVYAFTRARFPQGPGSGVMPSPVFAVYPAMLLAVGLVAAGVAAQLRQHVRAALTEAETKLKLDRIESDLRLARSIQRGLLPGRPPNVSGYDVAGWSKPADQTGGDYYDWLELPDGRVLFTIADVTGHGIGPALLSTACRAYFRAAAAGEDAPERITARVDALITADAPAGRFVTAAAALLVPAEHRLLLYSAGHGPIFHYVAGTGEVSEFGADQPPLGTGGGGDAPAESAREIRLAPGDALVLITDGFFECANAAGEQLGIGRLADLIRRHSSLGAGELIRRLYDEVVAFSGDAAQADDLTAVVIRRVGRQPA